jgi:CheY-like chemotaxis protein
VVTISTNEVWKSAAHLVEISVMDEGPGITEFERSRIFEPFYTTRRNTGGTGLGLATVLGTAEQHGGTVRVSTGESGGAIFTLALPASETESPTSLKVGDQAPSEPRQSLTILVVDDELSVAEVIRRLLVSQNHTVYVATRLEDARAIWKSHHQHIDLVLCDVVMPEMRGPDFVRRLSEAGAPPPTLFMSGYNEENIATVRCPVLAKPFSGAKLAATIAEFLVSRQLGTSLEVEEN